MRGSLIAGIAVFALVPGAVPVSAQNQMTRACSSDVRKFCGSHLGDRPAVRACMVENREKLSDECRAALKAQRASEAPPAGARVISYGGNSKQVLDFYRSKTSASAPVVVFIHGGGWSRGDKAEGSGHKPVYFTNAGYAFASINYRLVPDATVEQQAADVASAIAKLRSDAKVLGIEPTRFALMGHSAGAHLAALVATDPRYLKAAGVPMQVVKAAVLLDGAGYDVARQMNGAGPYLGEIYRAAFGNDLKRQHALSPTFHGAAPNSKAWLILYVADRRDSAAQSSGLAKALNMGGSSATARGVPNTTHRQLNQNLGIDGDQATVEVDDFLKEAL